MSADIVVGKMPMPDSFGTTPVKTTAHYTYREETHPMNDFIAVKTKPCCVCDKYEVWSLDREAVTRWQEGELIQNAFPDMSMGDREILISGTHPACWDKLFPGEDDDE